MSRYPTRWVLLAFALVEAGCCLAVLAGYRESAGSVAVGHLALAACLAYLTTLAPPGPPGGPPGVRAR